MSKYVSKAIKPPLYQDLFPLPVDRYLSFPPPPLHPRVGTYIPRPTCRASLRRVYQTSLKDLTSPLSDGFQEKHPADMPASNIVFAVFAAIGFTVSLIPLYWHLESWNVGTCAYMIWTALACLVHFVGAILWNGNALNWAPVWCDICMVFTHSFTRFLSLTNLIQHLAFKSLFGSHGPLAVSALSAASTLSPQPPL